MLPTEVEREHTTILSFIKGTELSVITMGAVEIQLWERDLINLDDSIPRISFLMKLKCSCLSEIKVHREKNKVSKLFQCLSVAGRIF